ncbi:MAG: preprotein translocase subunit SecA [Candidatus Auribacterota bacterium]
MFNWILKKIIGSRNERLIKKIKPLVQKINELEKSYQSLTEEQLKAKTSEFRERLSRGEALDDILPEAFAVVKNACRRLCGTSWLVCNHEVKWEMVPYDVQIIGGIVLHQGKIAEMATGEGKTLVATMPLYLNALEGKGAHLITVNDYLARRDSQWMGGVFKYLGLTVGCLQNSMEPQERHEQYACDITYGTNSEFGFDYLRDNTARNFENQVQRYHHYAIIDEVDSVLIDEARTPLIISGPVSVSTQEYDKQRPLVENLVRNQLMYCNRLIADAKTLIESDPEAAGIKLFQVSRGLPKNKQFLKLLEDPAIRKLYDKSELEMMRDENKEYAHDILESLFYVIDEKSNSVDLTEKGRETISPGDPDRYIIPDFITISQEIDEDEGVSESEKEQKKLQLQHDYERTNRIIHNLSQLLRAYSLFEKDVDYVVQDNRVMIVDEYTGRLMPGRRFGDGLHQALEAKERVKIERETQTFATITIQNYFRLYKKLAGMTGTAETEAQEFSQIYSLEVVVIPTNEPIRRLDLDDVIYKTKREKLNAIIDEIVECNTRQQPVLVGTISVETSELLSRMLRMRKIPHQVLNAKYHEKEAEIVAMAGQPGAVTIATNMAGRGTDIKLGPGVVNVDPRKEENGVFSMKKSKWQEYMKTYGGLHIIGTERHESRRIDRQLRGRAGRQGDPGSSRFYVSLEDDLMRLFGSDRIASVMERIGIEEGQELTHPLLNRSIETAQKRVEQRNFSSRKHVLEYDDVMNKQREVIYGYRNKILRKDGLKEMIIGMMEDEIAEKVAGFIPLDQKNADLNYEAFGLWWLETFLFPIDMKYIRSLKTGEEITAFASQWMKRHYDSKEMLEQPDRMRELEKMIALQTIDKLWIEHLYNMDNLRHDIGYRSYGQKDPLIEYKQESYVLFSQLVDDIRKDIVNIVFKASLIQPQEQRNIMANMVEQFAPQSSASIFDQVSAEREMFTNSPEAPARPDLKPLTRQLPKVGRNELCPCGSGKKFKKCCGN